MQIIIDGMVYDLELLAIALRYAAPNEPGADLLILAAEAIEIVDTKQNTKKPGVA